MTVKEDFKNNLEETTKVVGDVRAFITECKNYITDKGFLGGGDSAELAKMLEVAQAHLAKMVNASKSITATLNRVQATTPQEEVAGAKARAQAMGALEQNVRNKVDALPWIYVVDPNPATRPQLNQLLRAKTEGERSNINSVLTDISEALQSLMREFFIVNKTISKAQELDNCTAVPLVKPPATRPGMSR